MHISSYVSGPWKFAMVTVILMRNATEGVHADVDDQVDADLLTAFMNLADEPPVMGMGAQGNVGDPMPPMPPLVIPLQAVITTSSGSKGGSSGASSSSGGSSGRGASSSSSSSSSGVIAPLSVAIPGLGRHPNANSK
jgi:hypothetical protein